MARRFELPNYKRDDYNRPERKWLCGHALHGRGCPFGPDAAGRCHTTGECRPRRQGDRWVCTRPESHGGTCPDGPLPDGTCCRQVGPCQPQLSLRAQRGRWVIATLVASVGLLFWLFAGANRERGLDPGPLTSAHAMSNARCADCHLMATGATAGLADQAHASSAHCLECHSLGDSPHSPHGIEAPELARLSQAAARTADAQAGSIVLALARFARSETSGTMECAACHREHRGRDASLTTMTDQQCQVCHQASFASFGKGHPEFSEYPYRRRTRLIFDHASHLPGHFAEQSVEGAAGAHCSRCHAPSPMGGTMLVRGFEQSCASCHKGQIEGEGRAGDKGLAFFRVPGLDARTLAEKGHWVGDWPEFADADITPFMRLLLSCDANLAPELAALAGTDLLDLRRATPAQLAAAENLAWGIKELFADLVTKGQSALVSRLAVRAPRGTESTRSLAAQLPRAALLAAQRDWFPNLLVEIVDRRAGRRPAPPAPPASPAAPPVAPVKPPPASDDLGDLLLDAPPAKAAKTPADTGDILAGGDDLLADLAPPPGAPATKPPADDLLDLDLAAAPSTPAAAAPEPPKTQPLAIETPENWVAVGGWYYQENNFTLYYRPTGHADRFLTDWISVAGELSEGRAEGIARGLFHALTDAKAPGLCAKCHATEATPGSRALVVNWHGARSMPEHHPATKFDHGKHFSLLSEQGCQTCHQLDRGADYRAAFASGFDSSVFRSNFTALSKETCARCHNARVAGDGCQVCHNYHTGMFATALPTSSPAPRPAAAGSP